MKKKTIIILQLFIIFIGFGCLVGAAASASRPIAASTNQPPSEFDLWSKGEISEIQINAGKEKLTNYRELFHIGFDGKNEKGAPVVMSHEYLVEMDKSRSAQREVEIVQSPDAYLNGTREGGITPDYVYNIHSAATGGLVCETSPINSSENIQLSFHTNFLEAIVPGKLLERNVLENGVLADVYEIKKVSLFFRNDLNNINGKVWIAREPAYFLKAEGTVEGVVWFDNAPFTGIATFSYDVKEQNHVIVQPPDLCAHPPSDLIPLPLNITDLGKSPTDLYYNSAESKDQIKAFYNQELPARGWEVEELAADAYPKVLRASMTTPHAIQISIEIQIHAMSDGSYVVITWMAH